MVRLWIMCLALAAAIQAAELPGVALAGAAWTASEGVLLEAGIATLQGDPAGYRRLTLTLPGALLAGRTVRFSALVTAAGLRASRDITYASPKLKVINEGTKAVMAVNNFGTAEVADWAPVHVDVTIPKGHETPITLELGLQLCEGVLKVKDVALAEVQPWRWRVLDGDHKSYFDR